MTAPNEPGLPGPVDGPGRRNGSAEVAGQRPGPRPAAPRVNDVGDAPPRPRSGARPAAGTSRPPEPPPRQESRPPGGSPGADARLSRFIAGATSSLAPALTAKPAPGELDRVPDDGKQSDAYASELPDLSRPASRGAARTPTVDRGEPGVPGRAPERRVQVASRARGPVRASMQIRRIDPWSALKVSLLLSIALFFVWMIAVAFLYLLLGSMGVWSKLNSNVGDLLTNTSGAGELVSSGSIFGGATLIGLVNIVLLTAMATLGAVVYNLSTDVVGGIEVTLADRD